MSLAVVEQTSPESRFERLSKVVSRLHVVPLFPDGRAVLLPKSDDDMTVEDERDDSSGWSAFISYRDVKGDESHRRITCRRISGCYGEPEVITAFCHERRAPRCFRIDRILEMACVATGEMLDPLAHFSMLAATGALKLDDRALDALGNALVFLARCDGDLHPLEHSAIGEAFGKYIRWFGGDDRTLETAVVESARLAPDGGDMMSALRTFARLPQGSQICRLMLDCGAAVIDADGRHHPEEITWALEVSDALKHIADRR